MTNIKIDNKAFNKQLIKLAFPIAIQNLMLALVSACDALMLGQVEQNQMTAVSLATQIQFVQNMFLSGGTTAGAILGAQYWGKKDINSIEWIFGMMLRFCGIVSLVFFVACELFPSVLMSIFTSDKLLIEIGTEYLKIAGYSYLLTGISQCYLSIMKVTDHVKESAIISSSAVVLNIIFNAVFIFGLFNIPKLNSNGAALATTISRIVELIICIIISSKKEYIRPKLKKLLYINKTLSHDFRKQCLPLMGGMLCWGIGFTSYTAIIGHIGTDAAAANSVAAVFRDLICCLCNGIGTASGIIVGNELGAGNLEKGKAYGIKLRNISFITGFISMGLVLILTPIIVNVVKLTDEARGYLVGMMVIMSVYMIGRCVNTITINRVLDSGGDTLFDMYSLIVSMWGIAIPLALLSAFVFHLPVLVVYACTCIDEVGKIPWVMIRFKKFKWVKNLTDTTI